MKAIVQIQVENEATVGEDEKCANGRELARILRVAADHCEAELEVPAGDRHTLRDINGNNVGSFRTTKR